MNDGKRVQRGSTLSLRFQRYGDWPASGESGPWGFVAGLYARTDANRGVWKALAGTEASLTDVIGVKTMLTEDENGVLNPQAVNCIRNFPVYGTIIWGARTLQGNDEWGSEWKYIPVRRTALFLLVRIGLSKELLIYVVPFLPFYL